MSIARLSLLLVAVAFFLTALIASKPNSTPQLGDPLPGLNSDQLAAFQAGQQHFQDVETVEDGLGPVFNDSSCAACHTTTTSANVAIGGTNGRLETRFGYMDTDGAFNPMSDFGGSLIQDHGIGLYNGVNFVAETVPAGAHVTARRRTTPLFGLGLVDAVPDQTFVALAALEKMISPSTAGTVAWVYDIPTTTNKVGKFGWKNQNPNLFQFSADAYLNEMGITSPLFPNENCPQGDCAMLLAGNPRPDMNDADGHDVQAFADFMRLLAPPPRGPVSASVNRGEVLFYATGCAGCHTPNLITGSSDVAALDHKVFSPYSDFLLHDMGSLGDGITQGPATGALMRTAPLWGLRFETSLLHDGRANDSDPNTRAGQAILAHDGQGKKSRDQFTALSDKQKSDLLAFLNSL